MNLFKATVFCMLLTVVLHYSQTLCRDGHLRKSCSDQRSRKWQIPVHEPQGETSGQGMLPPSYLEILQEMYYNFCWRKCIRFLSQLDFARHIKSLIINL